jgi:hypothetical protein
MTILRWWLLVMVVLIAYVAGQNRGMNLGWERALLQEPQCNRVDSCLLH